MKKRSLADRMRWRWELWTRPANWYLWAARHVPARWRYWAVIVAWADVTHKDPTLAPDQVTTLMLLTALNPDGRF